MVAKVPIKYEANSGNIHQMQLSPDFAAAAGTEPTGAVDSDIIPKVSKSDREFGIRPRGVRLVRTVGTAPDTFKKYTFVPVMTATEWNSATYAKGATVTVGSIDYVVSSRLDEDF